MRKMVAESMLAAVLVIIAALFLFLPGRPQMWIYPVVRQATQAKLNYETRAMTAYENAAFYH